MRCRWLLVAMALWMGGVAATVSAETVVEAYRNPFGIPRAVAANPTDGSVWAVTGSTVMHFAADGTVLRVVGDLASPLALAVNPADGSCWVADTYRHQLVHLAPDGSELWRSEAWLYAACSVSVSPDDGSAWCGYSGGVAHFGADGTLLGQMDTAASLLAVSVDPRDGSCWVADTLGGQVIHLGADGAELWSGGGLGRPQSIAVDPNDGSFWVADDARGEVVHFAADGTRAWQGGGFFSPHSVSVDPRDGSCWVADSGNHRAAHLAAAGSVLSTWDSGTDAAESVSVDARDGSCWVAALSSTMVHLSASGGELWRREGVGRVWSVSVDPTDDSCWMVTDSRVRHLSENGEELWQAGIGPGPHAVSVDPADGSCWVGTDHGLVHLARDGTQLWRSGTSDQYFSVAVNPSDGSCWGGDWTNGMALHVSREGVELGRAEGLNAPASLSVDPRNGSCWLAEPWSDRLTHVAADGTLLWSTGSIAEPYGLSVDPNDGSCWIGQLYDGTLIHLAEDGTELWKSDLGQAAALAVNPRDSSCWAAPGLFVTHLGADGTELWREMGFDGPLSLSVNPVDGSCWVADTNDGQVVHLVVLGDRFPDVNKYYWASDGINACAEAGIAQGYDDGLYHPDFAITRDQMAVYIARALALPTGDAAVPPGPEVATFEDVPHTGYGESGTEPYWAYKYIEYCVDQGVVEGYDPTHYWPEVVVTRDQMAVFVARAQGWVHLGDSMATAPEVFPDVPAGFWSGTAIQSCVSHGVVQGYDDGLYHPEFEVKRDQMAVYIARAFELE